jgi:iron complex outermembrane receptor protein
LRFTPNIFILSALLFPPLACAQDGESAAEDFFDETPLVLTASRMAKPLLESPASVSIIDRQMIAASGVREIADLFRLVPGFVVGFHNGHTPIVTYHGLGQEFARQMQVLVDGRSVFIPSFGGVPWSNLPLLLEDIERIEVIRGPNAVTYGANAFLATINIITRHAAEDLGTQYSVTSSDNANPDIEDAYLRIGSQHDDVDWRLSLGTINDAGFAAIEDSKRVAKANLRIDLLSHSNQFWTMQLGTSSSQLGRGFPQSEDNPTDIERDEDATNSYLNLQWEGAWESSTSIARLTHTRQEVTDNYDPGPFTFQGVPGITTYIDFDRTSERTDLEFIQTDDIGESVRLVYGGSVRRDKVKSLFLLNDNSYHEVDTGRLFGGVEWRFEENWLLDLGVMLEDSSLTSRESSPRVSLIRKFGRNHALRMVASVAKRNPVLWEAEGETEFVGQVPLLGTLVVPRWTGNEDIEPEHIESFEIGLRSQLAAGFESDIKLFRYRIEDHIIETVMTVTIPLGPVPVGTSANDETTEVEGLELALGYRPGDRLRIDGGISIIDAESSFKNFEESIPDYTAFVGAGYRIGPRHEISGVFYYTDDISWLDSNDDIPPARRLDLRYAYHLKNEINIEIIGQNLYEDITDYEDENIHDQVVYLRLSGGF